jgi:hypothetical protein
MTMEKTTGPCTLDDGTRVRAVSHWHCTVCGSDLFDLEAMRAIRAQRHALAKVA